MDEGYRQRVGSRCRRLSVEYDLTGVGGVDAGEHFDQRRFASPILTEQSVNFSATDVKVDMIERKRPRESLDETPHREERRNAALGTNVIECDSRGNGPQRSFVRATSPEGRSRRTG